MGKNYQRIGIGLLWVVAIFVADLTYKEYLVRKYWVDDIPEDIQRSLVLGATGDATVEVVGGGGAGGINLNTGGGGGGGGEYHRCGETLTVQSYTVTLGTVPGGDSTSEADSTFSGTGISITADGGNGSGGVSAGTAGTGGTVTDCDTGPTTYAGGTPGLGQNNGDTSGGGGGGAGYGGKGGNGADGGAGTVGGGGGGGAGESAAGGNASGSTGGTGGTGGGGNGGNGGTSVGDFGKAGSAGVPATYLMVGGGGGGGADNAAGAGACGVPGGGGGGGETGASNGCRGEIRVIYIDADVDATGGTETTSGIYRIHTFTTSGTFTVNSVVAVASINYPSEFFMQ